MRRATKEKAQGRKPTACCNEVWSPVRTLLATRGARGTYAHDTTRWHVGTGHFLKFGLCESDAVKIPLGWVLSEGVRSEMARQLDQQRSGAVEHPGKIKATKDLMIK